VIGERSREKSGKSKKGKKRKETREKEITGVQAAFLLGQ
jgi:hypothetical protein